MIRGFTILLFCFVGKLLAGMFAEAVCQEKLQAGHMVAADTSVRDTFSLPAIPRRPTEIPLVYLPDSLIRDSLRYEFVKIKNAAYKNRWTKELYNMVFVDPSPGRVNVMRTQNSEERFRDFQGKTIRSLTVKVLPPYGTSVYDTIYQEEDLGWLRTVANRTHMKTAERVIRKQITIRPGMVLYPFELVQNEILLRQLDYIDDAAFILSAVPGDTAAVNVLLVCKDEFSWNGNLESNFLNSFSVGFGNKNFMKLGHTINYELSYRGRKDKKWGNMLEYKVNSIWGTYINFRGYYQNDYREKLVTAEFERPFLTSATKWAGGVGAGRIFYSDNLPDRNVTRLETKFDYHTQDVWLGKSFSLSPRYSYNRNMYVTGRFFTALFNNRPLVTSDTNHFYYDRLNYFLAFTYTHLKYYKANLIYDFGNTEDIPSGLLARFMGGYETNEFQKSGYMSVFCHYAHFDKNTERYYSLEVALGSYLRKNGFERGMIKFGAGYISNLYQFGKYRFRFYSDVNYIRGIRRYPSDYLYFRDYDIRGFTSDTLRGIQKLSATVSGSYFLPYIKKGFRLSVSGFVDAGVVAPQEKALLKNKVYWGIGAALNLRNDNVIIKNISFRFAWYPVIPDDGRSFQAILYSGRKGGFYDYRVAKPQMTPYE